MGNLRIGSFEEDIGNYKKIAVDSMIFIYHFANHPVYAPFSTFIFNQAEKGKLTLFTSMISIIECLVLPNKKNNLELVAEYEKVFQYFPNLKIIPLDWPLARLISKLRAHYPKTKLPDLANVAAGLLNEADIFITNDKQLKKISEIKTITLAEYI